MSDYPAFVFRSEKGHDPDMCPWCDECAERARSTNTAVDHAHAQLNAIHKIVFEDASLGWEHCVRRIAAVLEEGHRNGQA
jgi:hypothetical protein